MAPSFNILKLEWDSSSWSYHAEVEMGGNRARYEIKCNGGKIYWPDLMICDSEDRIPENGEVEIIVQGSGRNERARHLEEALREFMKAQNEPEETSK